MNRSVDSIVASQQLFLDSRSTQLPAKQDEITVNVNTNSGRGNELRLSLTELSIPNKGVLDQASFPDGTAGVHTLYVRVQGVGLNSKESAELGATIVGTVSNELFGSSILAKVPVVAGSDYVQFYAPHERSCLAHLNAPNIGTMRVSLTDHRGVELRNIDGLAPFFSTEFGDLNKDVDLSKNIQDAATGFTLQADLALNDDEVVVEPGYGAVVGSGSGLTVKGDGTKITSVIVNTKGTMYSPGSVLVVSKDDLGNGATSDLRVLVTKENITGGEGYFSMALRLDVVRMSFSEDAGYVEDVLEVGPKESSYGFLSGKQNAYKPLQYSS